MLWQIFSLQKNPPKPPQSSWQTSKSSVKASSLSSSSAARNLNLLLNSLPSSLSTVKVTSTTSSFPVNVICVEQRYSPSPTRSHSISVFSEPTSIIPTGISLP